MSKASQATARTNTGRGPAEEFRAQLVQLFEENEGFREQVTEIADALSAAVTAHKSGNLEQAEAGYRGILARLPNHPQALHMLGAIELQRGNVQAAIDTIRRAIQVHPGHPEAWVNLGAALRAINDNKEAMSAYQRAIKLKPDMILAYTELSRLLMEIGRYEAAVSYCEAAVAIDPGSMPARIQLAIAFRWAGRVQDAKRHWSEIIALAPNRAETYYVLGTQFRDLGQLPEALRCHNNALALKPDIPEFLCAKGATLIYLNRADDALGCFERAEALSPDMPDALAGIGWALRSLGRFEEADGYSHKVRALSPGDLRSYKHVFSEGKALEVEEELHLIELLERSDTGTDGRITAGFGLGRLFDKAGRYDEAFARYAAANALVREIWPRMADQFDKDGFSVRIEQLIEGFPDRSSVAPADFSNMSELPVFVVGMPRSGTTLVEQICASHSRVFGAGELGDIIRLDNVLNRPDVAGSVDKFHQTARQLAKDHIVKLYGDAKGACRVVDKMPDNVLHVGLVMRLFPRARIIWCSRDDRDTALSCYFQMFSPGAQHFSYDLADCGHRARLIDRLARHWMTLLPNRMIEMNYETLTADLEGQSRRLIEFLGLEWEPACLDFHLTERPVSTVSYWQVRQPLYQSSVGRWRNYEKHLGPLFEALSRHE
ncbi:tetratricopeptide repeat-containing sulfotransferase family protein [Bradyrhizobium acaciae]|uniref:tetratricopeptide repeat-containing sulfotransferase family protein n=1 Tax=Bradyrhizobium acaciae TaxID=2683706 RepID=UPI001E615EAA|nr:tetratricopeptide repeat-containing sulfotransferase family protein [Bradyrhizobium acaciae]MCC8977394.1 sulfotransferase [Bradyrhizobium acaciae]